MRLIECCVVLVRRIYGYIYARKTLISFALYQAWFKVGFNSVSWCRDRRWKGCCIIRKCVIQSYECVEGEIGCIIRAVDRKTDLMKKNVRTLLLLLYSYSV